MIKCKNPNITSLNSYTKHYYIGGERIASSIGTGNSVGYYLCDSNFSVQDYTAFLNQKMTQATQGLQDDYDYFEKQLVLNNPFTNRPSCTISHSGGQLNYWFHPDLPIIIGMGSSSYISDNNGEISQHLEYLPFGETLVEEHKNSNNSPYKFNGKELDDETGDYYGARYLNPKWSFWLSVDPLMEKYPGWSPYNYTMLNPVRLVDPDGRSVEEPPKNGIPQWVDETGIYFWNSEKNAYEQYSYINGERTSYAFSGYCRVEENPNNSQKTKDHTGNISIDGVTKAGHGMENRTWKRGDHVEHIAWNELPYSTQNGITTRSKLLNWLREMFYGAETVHDLVEEVRPSKEWIMTKDDVVNSSLKNMSKSNVQTVLLDTTHFEIDFGKKMLRKEQERDLSEVRRKEFKK